MKVVLFCGGLGTRLREHSDTIPKPLVNVGLRPILWHPMRYYAHFGHKDFILCLGYRGDLIREYFLNYNECMSNDFTLSDGGWTIELHSTDTQDWRFTFVDTGLHSTIGQRLLRVRGYLRGEEEFLANYRDGLSDLPLDELIDDFRRKNVTASFAAVRTWHDLAREAMVTRSRDLDAFSYGDPDDVRLIDCGDGLVFACIGVVPERRLMLETVYAFLTLKNGLPIGYALGSALLQFSEIFEQQELEETNEQEWQVLQTALDGALSDLIAMRNREGTQLEQDFRKRLDLLLEKIDSIEAISREQVPRERDRLRDERASIVEALGAVHCPECETVFMVTVPAFAAQGTASEEKR